MAPKAKTFDSKFSKNKKPSVQGSSKHDRFLKYKNPTEDWAGDVEKAIRAALEEDGIRNQDSKSKSKNNRNKSRKRLRDEREEDRNKEQKVLKCMRFLVIIKYIISCYISHDGVLEQ